MSKGRVVDPPDAPEVLGAAGPPNAATVASPRDIIEVELADPTDVTDVTDPTDVGAVTDVARARREASALTILDGYQGR
jgi:hypothetical protein